MANFDSKRDGADGGTGAEKLSRTLILSSQLVERLRRAIAAVERSVAESRAHVLSSKALLEGLATEGDVEAAAAPNSAASGAKKLSAHGSASAAVG